MARQDLIDAALNRRVSPNIGEVWQPGIGWTRPAPTTLPLASKPPRMSITPKFTVSAYVPPEAYANQPSTTQARPFTLAPAYSAARSSDDLVRSAIEGRRASLAAERNQVIEQLNSLPQGKGSAQRVRSLQAQLSSIESQDRTAAHDERSHAFQLAHQTTLDHKAERDIQSSQQHTALVQGLEQISGQHPPGTPEHANAVLKLRSDIATAYPLGKLPKEGTDLLKAHSAIHDDLATQAARAKAAGFDVTGFRTTKEGAVNVSAKRASDLAAKDLHTAYGLTPEMLQKNVIGVGTPEWNATKDKVINFNQNDQDVTPGTHVRIDTGTKKGIVDLPVETYLKLGGQLSPEDQARQIKAGRMQPQAPQQQPTATGSDSPQLVHYDFRTPTGAFGHDLPANLHPDTVNAIASAYSIGDKETGTRLAQEAVQPQQQQATPVVAAASPSVDQRTALAQRALADPNATEEHKAAARRILGVQ